MTTVNLALQKAILAALKAALACEVYQDAPREAAFPFVAIDRIVRRPADTHSTLYTTHLVYLSVWSRYEGNREVLEIIGDGPDSAGAGGSGIKGALHNASLILDRGRALSCVVIADEDRRDADDLSYMGSVTVRIITQDT